MTHVRRFVVPVAFVGLILLAWQVIEDHVDRERVKSGETTLEIFLPTPGTIAQTFSDRWGEIAEALVATVTRASVGFAVGVVAAVLVAIAYWLLPLARHTTMPAAYALNSFPIVGLAPAIVLLFGQGSFASMAVIAALVSYFPVLIMVDAALTRLGEEYLEFFALNRVNRVQAARHVLIPLTVPSLLAAMRLAAPAALVGATIAEWMGARDGLGNLMAVSLYQLEPGLLFAALVTVAAAAAVAALTIEVFERALRRRGAAA